MKKHTDTAATWHKMAAAHTSAAAKQSASSSSGRRHLGSSLMRPRVVHGDGFTCSDDGDVAQLATTGATSRRSRRRHPARQRRRRRTAWRPWSAPDHGVGSPVDRRQLTTSGRFRSGHSHQCSGQTAHSVFSTHQTYRRPFTITTDVKLTENAHVSTVFQSTLRVAHVSR